jgi:hypothetical protein
MSSTLKLVVDRSQWEFLAGQRRLAGGATPRIHGLSITRVDGRISNLVLVTSEQSQSLFPVSDQECEWLQDELQSFLKSKEENNLSSDASW